MSASLIFSNCPLLDGVISPDEWDALQQLLQAKQQELDMGINGGSIRKRLAKIMGTVSAAAMI